MYKNRSQGFTLIELLVVIAIIGILSAVVLASLNTARSKGNNAAIQSDLSTAQTQAEIYYGGTGANSYGSSSNQYALNTCPTGGSSMFVMDATMKKSIAQALTSGGSSGLVHCVSTASEYAIDAKLATPIGTDTYWCVDSTGTAKSEAVALTGNACTP